MHTDSTPPSAHLPMYVEKSSVEGSRMPRNKDTNVITETSLFKHAGFSRVLVTFPVQDDKQTTETGINTHVA